MADFTDTVFLDGTDMFIPLSLPDDITAFKDIVPPSFSAFSPAAGVISRTASVSVTAGDDKGIARIGVWVYFSNLNRREMAYDGQSWDSRYSAGSSVGGTVFSAPITIVRANGWPDTSFTVYVDATDAGGNVTRTSAVYTTAGSYGPVVSAFSPGSSSSISGTATVAFDVTDNIGTTVTEVRAARTASGVTEVIWANGAFTAKYASSTRTVITDGHHFVVSRTGGWSDSGLVVSVTTEDADGNTTTSSSTYTVTSTYVPVINGFTPAAASVLTNASTVAFDVTDNVGVTVTEVRAARSAAGVTEVVWANGAFTSLYSGSVRSSITNGHHFVLSRTGGWRDSGLLVSVTAADADGNSVEASAAYTVTGSVPTVPVVGNFNPTSGTPITKYTPLTVDVTDVSDQAQITQIDVYFRGTDEVAGTGECEVAWKDGQWRPYYVASSSRAPIANGWRYTVLRKGGWQSPPSLELTVVDSEGHIV